MCLSCEDISRQSCAMVHRWRFFGDFLRPVFSASRMQQVSDLHLKIALRPHHVWTSNLRRMRLDEEKRSKTEEETTGQKYNDLPYSIGRHNKVTGTLEVYACHSVRLTGLLVISSSLQGYCFHRHFSSLYLLAG